MSDNIKTGDDFLGRGVAFPLRFENGKLAMNAYEDQVKQSIQLILRTMQGERVMRPDFGGGMETLAFEPMNPALTAFLQYRIKDVLIRFEPRIDVLNVLVATAEEQGELQVDIQYRVKSTLSINNLVYPFYIEQGGT